MALLTEEPDQEALCQRCTPVSYEQQQISIGHGGGGRLSHSLLEQLIRPVFGEKLQSQTDSALCKFDQIELALTTDSYVVRPRFFPGGDIGALAVIGTANDLAMVGAQIKYLSCALIIEEGFSTDELHQILCSMQRLSEKIGFEIVTGDTKVVEKGCGDGLYINTTGIGLRNGANVYHPRNIPVGADVILSGDLGRHEACIVAARDQIQVADLQSDCAWLGGMVLPLLEAHNHIFCLRDVTRGGLAATLNECALVAEVCIEVEEAAIPVIEPVQSLCDLLGYDPLHLANEGRCVIFSSPEETPQILTQLHSQALGQDACVIGSVKPKGVAPLVMNTFYGTQRIVPMPSGELLSRIC